MGDAEELNNAGVQQDEQIVEIPADVVSKTEYEALKSELDSARQQLAQVQEMMMSPEFVEFMRSRRLGTQPAAEPHGSKEAEEEPEPDYEEMTPQQLAAFVVKKVKQELSPYLQTYEDKMRLLEVQQDIARCEKKYPDFWQYRDAMYQLALQNPTLKAEEAYLMAKGKVSAMRPTAPAKQSAENKPATTQQLSKHKGPTTSERPRVAPASTAKSGGMTLEEAFEQAWEKEFGSSG